MNVTRAWQLLPILGQPPGYPERKQNSERSTDQGNKKTFCHLLANESQPASTQRAANSHLFAPCRAARDQQVGNVQAGNQQHAAHSAQQYQNGVFALTTTSSI